MRKTYLGVMVVVLLLLNIVFVSADVFINEVMYNPTGTDTGHEWIEIYNNGSDSFNISAWKLYEGSTNHGLTLVQGTDNLSAESYAIIASDDAIFIADYPAFAGNLFDSAFSSGLSNSGEELTIKNSSLDIMDSIVYSNSWGDNEGYSLELINPSLDNNLSGSWRNSLILNGTPGQQNSVYDTGNPVANFTPQESIIEGQYALFNSSLSYDDSYISNYQWNFSDNNVTNTSSSAIYHKFLQNGTYNVNLTVADKVGFTDSMSKQIIVNDAVPVANFILSNSTPQEDQSITFTNSSTSYDPIISLFWQFGDDGTTAATQNVSHIFTKDGVYEVNLTVMDDDGSVSIISNNITVSYVNDAPVITTASINATLEDSNYTYDVNAIDEEGDNLTYSLAVYPSGMVINSTDGMIRWLPTNSGVGLHNVIVNVSDVFGAYTIQSYVLNVTNINDDPVLGAVGNKTIVQDSKLTIQLSSSDIDPTNDTLTYSITSSLGTLNTTSGLFEWTPDYTYYGPYEVNFKVIDGNGGQDNETIAVYVYPTLNISAVSVNSQSITDGGIIQNIKPGDSISTSVTVNNLVSGLNLDDVNITLESIDFKVAKIESVGILSGASSSTKTISFNVPYNISTGLHSVLIEANGLDHNDQDVRYSNFTYYVNITKSDDDVVISGASLDNNTIKCAAQAILSVNVSNIGNLDQSKVNVSVSQPGLGLSQYNSFGLSVNETRNNLFTIDTTGRAAGTYNITVNSVYYNGAYDTEYVALTIENCEPSLVGTIGDISVLEGSYNSSLDLTQYFSDLFNNDTLTYTVNGNVTNLNFNDFASFGLVNISPSENYVGTNVINFTANDGKGGSKTSNNLIVTVTNQNDAPTIIVDNQEFNENETKVFYITASDIDPTNDVLTIGTNASLGTFTQINNTYAKLNWTPTNSDVGTYYVLFNVSDGLGGTANKTVVLTVSNVNNVPVLSDIANIDTYQGNATKFQLHCSDVDSGAVLTYSCNVTAMGVVKVNDSLANVTWTPTNSDVGNKSVKCTVTDNAGAFDYKIFNINVININDAPSITNLPASKTGVVGQSFVYDVNAIDVDGDNSTFTSNSTIFTINSTSGVIDFTPAVKGTYSINVTADDGNGGIDSEILSLTIYDTLSIANTQVSVDNGAYTALGYGETLSSTVSQGQSLKLQADFKNWLDTNNMNLVLINATLKDGSFSKSKIESIIPLNKTKQVTKVMDLGIIPANAENGNYTLQIKAVGYYGSENVTADWNAFVSVESDSNQIFIIEPTVVIPSSIQCVRDIIVNATVKNMAVNLDQNITVTVLQSSLGINQQSESQVVNRGQNGEFTLPVSIAFDKPAGNYSITIKATSDYGGFSQITKNLEVKACQLTFDPATNPTISNSANQIFTISNSGIDLTIAKVEWEKNGVSVGTNSTSYPYVAEIQTGRLTHTIYAKVTDNLGNIFEKTWTLTTTSYPIADTMAVSPTLSSLNETQLQNVSSLTLSKSGYGTIQFLEPVDLSGIVLLDGHVNFSGGIIAVDTSGSLYGQLNHPARIIMTGLTYNEVPKIYYSSGFTTNPSSITTNCTNTFCFLQQYTAPPTTNGEVIFNVTHLSSYRVGTTAIVPPTNAAVANAGSDQTVAVNTLVTLDGSGSTGDSPIIYSWTAPSGVTLSSTTAQKPTFTPTSTGTYTFVLTATNAYGSSTDSVTINVQQSTTASGNLTITDLNIKVGGKSSNDLSNGDTISRDAKPGDTLKFDVEATNMFSTDTEIRDIEISVTIKDIDDGDDLDDDMDIDDLDDGDDDSAVFEFTVPTLVDEDTYDVIIKAKGKDENGKTQEDVWELKLDVEKDKHEILVDRADLSPQTLTCSRNANIDVKLVNIGREDEDDVSVEIINDALGINLKQTGIDLEEGSDDDSVYEQTFRISIADDAEAGTYPILVKSYYDGKSSGQETVDLVVDDCVNIYTPVETEPEIEVVTTTPTTTPVKTTTTISFMDESVYLTLLAVLFVVLLGGVVFLVGAAVIILKKRR